MGNLESLARAALLTVMLASCRKNPDPLHIDLGDFNSPKQLTDTLKRLIPVGMKEPVVWEMMQRNGFACGERSGIIVDNGKLGSGKPDLECYKSTRIDLGLRRRAWTVVFKLDSGRVSDVNAGYIYQDL
jgi:hypothetical protein